MYREQFRFGADGAPRSGRAAHPGRQGEVRRDLPARTSRPIATRLRIRVPVQQAPRPVPPDRDEPGLRRHAACAIRRWRAASTCGWPASAATAACASLSSGDLPPPGADAQRRRAADGLRRGINTASPTDGARIDAALQLGRLLDRRRRVLRRRRAAVVHAVRAADAADPVVDHRRRRRGGSEPRRAAWRWRRATRSAWRWSTPRSASPPGWPAKGLAAWLQTPWVLGAVRARCWSRCRCRCSASTSCSCRRRWRGALDAVVAAPARRHAGRRVRDGRRVGADRQPVRRRAAGRRAGLPQPDARCRARRQRAVRAGRRHERAAAAARRVGRRVAAARRRVDGRREAPVRRAAAGGGASGSCSRCCRRRWRWRCGARC